jgi:hypothetical protein
MDRLATPELYATHSMSSEIPASCWLYATRKELAQRGVHSAAVIVYLAYTRIV